MPILNANKTLAIQVFNYDQSTIRFGRDDDGTPWVVGVDLATALGYANPHDALIKHVDPEYKGVAFCEGKRGRREMIKVYEPGIYELITNSQLSTAKQFRKWIFAEVLPSIRKYGAYILPQSMDKKVIREKSKEDRKGITAAWHDVGGITKPYEYKNLTDAMSKACIGMTAKQFREANGLKKDANTRDHMSKAQLLSLSASEVVATEYVYRELPYGYYACKEISIRSGNVGNEILEILNRALEPAPVQKLERNKPCKIAKQESEGGEDAK